MPEEVSALPLVRTRLAMALVAMVGIALELVLMRGLAIRFSSHFAGLVISVGLLGFGAAGSFLTLFRAFIMKRQRATLVVLCLLLAMTIPAVWWLSLLLPLNINYLAWSRSEFPNVLMLELLMVAPFLLVGMFIGVVLMDSSRRVNGHYASDLLGSGAGGIGAIVAMSFLPVAPLAALLGAGAILAALLLLDLKRPSQWAAALLAIAVAVTLSVLMPVEPAAKDNDYKPLTTIRRIAGTRIIHRDYGPLGRIDVVDQPQSHSAPQMSLNYAEEMPPHLELFVDGDGPALIYDVKKIEDWAFTDWRTTAAPFHLLPRETLPSPKVCILDAGGGVDIGLSLLHGSRDITALQFNPQIIRAMRGPLAGRGGAIYDAPGVRIINQSPRGFFAANPETYDIILFPMMGGAGAAGADATQESYVYTIESVRSMIRHLSPNGILAMTRGISTPPREELRAFDLAVESLRAEGLEPANRLAMLRNGTFSSTILIFRQEITNPQIAALRAFSRRMSFDLSYLPGLEESQSNLFHRLPPPDPYFHGTRALVSAGETRDAYLRDSLFDLSAPTDDRPYFFHMYRPEGYAKYRETAGESSRAILEVSYLMLRVGIVEAILLAAVLILLPLAPGVRTLRATRGKLPCFAYFLMLGLGFMLLEMGFLHKLVLYLAHPIFAAAVAIASFLVFAGIGSGVCKSWRWSMERTATFAALAAVVLGAAYLFLLDPWLNVTQSWPVAARCFVAALTIAPLAFVMGHLFPLGLQRIGVSQPALVPWAWAINGFASVVASASTPLLAMHYGFTVVVLISLGCYLLAALLFRRIPHTA